MKRLLGVLTFFAVVLSGCDKDTDKPVAPSAERVSSGERVGALDGAAGVESVVPSGASAVAALDSASAAVDGAEVAQPVALDGASAAVAALDSASASAAVALDSAAVVDGAEVGSAVELAGASVAVAKVATDESLTPEEARAELESNGIAFTGAAFLSAARSGHLATVKLFVQAGMSLETVDDDLGWTALHKAAYASRLEVVKYLVGAGANIEARDEDGYTVLMNAAGIANNVSVVRFLVESGADVFAVGSDGKTARSLAGTVGNTAVADYLNSLENAGEFVQAAADGDLIRVRLFVEWGIDKEDKALVNVGGNSRERTALHAAARNGHLEIVQYLVGQGASVSSTDAAGATPLHAAVESGNLEIVRLLVSKGANVNAKDSSGETPLHYAASYGNKAIATHLVDNGGDLTIASSDGTTPAQVADLSGHTEVETYLESKTPRPDLVVQSPSVDNSTPGPGESLTVSATVRNSGTGSSASTTLRYYQSSDATITTGDTEVGTDSVDGLAASATSAQSLSLTAPSSAGTYYYGACVASVSGESDTNNNCSAGVQVTVVAPPDLVVQSPSVDNSTPGPGESLTVSATVRNSGTGSSASTTLRYYQSSDATISTGDTEVGTADAIGELAASATSAQSLSLTAPSSAGTYYYGACVASVSGESDTNNNCSAGVQVTVVAPPDLVVQSPSVDNSTLGPGESLTVSATVRNSGTGSSASTTLRYYQSSDATITTGDTEVGTDSVDGLAASATSAQSLSLTAPSSAGTYYYGACVASVSGESDTNNNCSAGVSVTVTLSPEQQARAALDSRGIAYTAGAFIDSARSGNLAVVKLFVQAGMSVETREDDYNRTALHWAAHGGRLEVVKYLVGQGASLTATGTAYSRTPLHLAARWGHLETVKYLVGAGANVNATDTNGRTPWGLARHHGQTAVVEYLGPKTALADLVVSASVDNSTPTAGQSLTLSATVRNQGTGSSASTTLRYYRSTDATITTGDTEVGSSDAVGALAASASSAQSSSVTAPSSAGTYYYGACVGSVSSESDTNNNCSAGVQVTVVAPPDLVVSASVDNSTPTAGQSLTLSATVRNQGTGSSASTTLRYYRSTDATITTGDTEVGSSDAVSGLAASASSAQSSSVTAPSSAGTYYYGACVASASGESNTTNNCSAGVQVTVRTKAEAARAELTRRGISYTAEAFAVSAQTSNIEVIALFVQAGMDIDTVVGEYGTALLYAAGYNNWSAMKSLIDLGADVNIANRHGMTALRYAVQSSDLEIVKYLVGKKASLTATQGGETLLHDAARDGYLEIVKYLVGQGLSVTATTNSGETPLHDAARWGHLEVVKYLVGAGASVSATDDEGQTPRDLAAHCSSNGWYQEALREKCRAVGTYLDSAGTHPDLVVQSASVDDTTPGPGESLTVSATVRNQGTGSSASTTLRYYRSTDATISTTDTEVGSSDAVSGLAASGTSAQLSSVTAPSTAGTYYYGACVAAVSAEINTTNNCSAGVTVTVTLSPQQQARAELTRRGTAYTADAFVAAARAGNLAVVRLFVQAGMPLETVIDGDWTALHWAAWEGRLEVVKYLVGQGASLTATNNGGSTPLHVAVSGRKLRKLEVVKYLVGQGASLTATNNNGWTALDVAARGDHLETIQYLVGQGASLTAATDDLGMTALHIAAKYGRLEVVKYLVGQGASLTATDDRGWMALHIAAVYGRLEVVKYLVGQGASLTATTNDGRSALDAARDYGQPAVATYLKSVGGIAYTADAFIAAARDGNLAVVKLFVQAGWSVETAATNGSTVLHYAAWKGHLSVVQYLVGQGANVLATNNVGWTPRDDARSAGHTAVVTYLESEARAELDSRGIAYTANAFIAAARDGNLAVVKLFVQAGASVTATDNEGKTPRDLADDAGHTAVVTYLESEARAELDSRGIAYTANAFVDSASAGNLAVVKLFVQAGMDIDATDSNSVTALLVASVWDHLAVVQYLVEQGADVNFRNTNGTTALHEAAALGHLEVVKYLVGQGADITATDNNDVWTPLHSAAYSGRLEVVKYLVEQGADITATDINSRTARSWTSSQAIRDYLESAARAELERLGISFNGSRFRSAAYDGNLALVKLFVEAGMSVEVRSRNYESPEEVKNPWRALHWAAYNGHLDVVIYLVRAGADIRATAVKIFEGVGIRGGFDIKKLTPRGWAAVCAGEDWTQSENCQSVVNYFDSLDDDDE